MNSSIKSIFNQLQKLSSLVVLVASAVWLLIAMGVADYFLTSQLQNLISVESAALERQSATVANAVGQHLAHLHGVAQVVANEAEVGKALAHAESPKTQVDLSIEKKKKIWQGNPVQASTNALLVKLANSLGVEVIYVMNAAGDCISSSNANQQVSFVGANYAQRDYFKSAIAGKNGYQYAVGATSKIPGLYFSAPIFAAGHIAGVAVAKINVSTLASWIEQSDAFIADQYGVIVLASDKSLEMKALPDSTVLAIAEKERMARYRKNEFEILGIGQWRTPALPPLKYFLHEQVPLLIEHATIDNEDLTAFVIRRAHFAEDFASRRLQLFAVLALLGIAIIAGVQFWLLLLRRREDIVTIKHDASVRLSRLVNRAPGMIFEYELRADGHAYFPYASEAIRDLYRVPPEEVCEEASRFFEVIHPEDHQAVVESFQLSASELTPWRQEYRVKFEDGSVHWLQGNALPRRQEDGSVLWNGFIMDITEQKKNELVLNESIRELMLRDVALSQISQGVTIAGVDRLNTYVNLGFEKITGYSSAEMLGKSTACLQGTDTDPAVVEKIRLALNAKKAFFGEILNYRKDGTSFWNELSIEPVFDARGELVQFIAVQRDVTERVRVREDLRLKEFALNTAANAIVITDPAGHVKWANASFSTLTGYSLEEAQGEILSSLVKSGLQSEEFYSEMWRVLLNKQVWRGELLNRRKDRSLYWEEMSIAPLLSEQGEVAHFVTVKQDISKRKTLERDMLDAADNMQGLLNAMAEGVFALDAFGQAVFVNRAFCEMLGYSEEGVLIGQRVFAYLGHCAIDGTPYTFEECKWMRVMSTQQPISVPHEIFTRKDGSQMPVEYWAHPIIKDHLVVGVIVTFVDISKRVMIQAEQVKMSGQLLKQNRLLQQYSEQVKEEELIARDFIQQFSSMGKISDPLVKFMLMPAANFSGDMVAFARTPDDRLHVLMADSAGHGLTAALAVIPITQPFYQMTAKGFDISAIAKEMNRRVRDYLPLPRYVACVLISLDTDMQTIQVWNGGCPPVIMTDEKGSYIEHRFQSKHLPLGVVKMAQFNGQVEHLSYDGRKVQLLSCSDGLTEMMSKHRGLEGYDTLMFEARELGDGGLFERLISVVKNEMAGQEPIDDITFVTVQCTATRGRSETIRETAVSESEWSKEFSSWELLHSSEPIWECKMTLTALQLKRLDVVPFLMGIIAQMEGQQANGKVFMVLSELFNNALDHGVLKLDSTLKHKYKDMEAYYEERENRMNNLQDGRVEMHLQQFSSDNGQLMKIHMKDSGDGFDPAALSFNMDDSGQRVRYGRGISLLRGTCNAIQYLGSGSEVIAYLELTSQRRD